MSQRTVVVNRGPKKDVRSRFVGDRDDATTTQRNTALLSAADKQTIMGYDITIRTFVSSDSSLTNDMYMGYKVYVANSAAYLTADAGIANSDDQAKEILFQGQLPVVKGVTFEKRFKSKGKRKMSKGQVLYISWVCSGIETDSHYQMDGLVYVGE